MPPNSPQAGAVDMDRGIRELEKGGEPVGGHRFAEGVDRGWAISKEAASDAGLERVTRYIRPSAFMIQRRPP